VVEQFMIEIGNLQTEHNVFLVGTTNHLENIDPRVLRGGGFSEKIEIRPPGQKGVERLLGKYLGNTRLEAPFQVEKVATRLTGLAPADLRGNLQCRQAVCTQPRRRLRSNPPARLVGL